MNKVLSFKATNFNSGTHTIKKPKPNQNKTEVQNYQSLGNTDPVANNTNCIV